MPEPVEPLPARAIAFIDGMNLFNAAKRAWLYNVPTYDAHALADAVCAKNGWNLVESRFYVGLPGESVDPRRHYWWRAKLRAMQGRGGVFAWSRELRYVHNDVGQLVLLNNGRADGREKGIDLRMALDAMELALANKFDVALLFTQDQDFAELVRSLKTVRNSLIVACAHPQGGTCVKSATSVPYDRAMYDAAKDPVDYTRQFSLKERTEVAAVYFIRDIATKWGKPILYAIPGGGQIAGTLRALIPITGGTHAYACIDDGNRLAVAKIPRPVWRFFDRDLGQFTTALVDATGAWTHARARTTSLAPNVL